MYKDFHPSRREYCFLEKTESTNSLLKEMIRKSDHPLFIVSCASEQTSGRGRLGRSFFSPGGGVYFSVSVPLSGKENNIPFTTLLAGLCVSEAIEELTGVSTQIKWPNDIYLNDRKLGGILCELVSSGKNLCAVIGIGINLSLKKEEIPSELSEIMTSFSAEGEAPPEAHMLVKSITVKLDKYIYDDKQLFCVSDKTVERIKSRSYSLGRKVRYSVGEEILEGIVTDIKNTGEAEITLSDGSVRNIFCGEIVNL